MAANPTQISQVQDIAVAQVDEFLQRATNAPAKQAADWALAAKNAMSVAVSCESVRKMRNGGGR